MKSEKIVSRKNFLRRVALTLTSGVVFNSLLVNQSKGNDYPKSSHGVNEILPSNNSSSKDFEFYEGKWEIRNKRLRTLFSNANNWYEFDATEEIEKRLDGLGYVGKYMAVIDSKPFEGLAIHLFDPESKLWSNWWADSFRGVMDPPVVGSYDKNIGKFYAKDFWNGKEIDLEFHWDVTDRDNPVWKQSFSDDKGKTWETNWYMYYKRVV